ncbi:MAG TPA: exosortase H-associated membrane protein [Gemmatimonadaceae bacterium]|nr:exosortase H-associated membrane protein [Gemmatimonadaceae bacterium]
MFASRGAVLAFLGRTLLALPVALALWYLAAPWLDALAAHVARPAIAWMSEGSVAPPVMRGGRAFFQVRLQAPYAGARTAPPAEAELDANVSLYTFGIALFAALSAAAKFSRRVVPIAAGLAVLARLPAWGVAFDVMKQLATTRELAPYLGFSDATRTAIALAFQIGSLLLPTLAPVALWVAFNHRALR